VNSIGGIRGIGPTTAALLAANALLLAIPLLGQRRARAYDPFHPIVVYSILFALPMVLIRGIYLASGGYSDVLDLTRDPREALNRALEFAFLGGLCLILGFYGLGRVTRFRRRPPAVLTTHRPLPLMSLVLLFAVGTAATLMLAAAGGFGSSLAGGVALDWTRISWLRPLGTWKNAALFLLIFGLLQDKKRSRIRVFAVIVAAGINLGFALVSGSRSALFFEILWMGAAVAYARYPIRRPRFILLWLTGAGLALLFGVLVVSIYREERAAWHGPYETITLERSLELTAESVNEAFGTGGRRNLEYVGERLIERFCSLDNLALAVSRADELANEERAAGTDNNISKELAWALVPRLLWPDKPLVGNFGLQFTRIYRESQIFTWNGPTVIGDLYRNFRSVGVILGMVLLGACLRWLYARLVVYGARQPLAALSYMTLAQVNWESTFSPFFTEGTRALISLAIISAVVRLQTEPGCGPADASLSRLSWTWKRARPGKTGHAAD
jgi:hypothetical protein